MRSYVLLCLLLTWRASVFTVVFCMRKGVVCWSVDVLMILKETMCCCATCTRGLPAHPGFVVSVDLSSPLLPLKILCLLQLTLNTLRRTTGEGWCEGGAGGVGGGVQVQQLTVFKVCKA